MKSKLSGAFAATVAGFGILFMMAAVPGSGLVYAKGLSGGFGGGGLGSPLHPMNPMQPGSPLHGMSPFSSGHSSDETPAAPGGSAEMGGSYQLDGTFADLEFYAVTLADQKSGIDKKCLMVKSKSRSFDPVIRCHQ